MQLEQSIAVRQTAEKEERSFAGFCGHQLQMCGCSQVEHRAAVLPAAVTPAFSHVVTGELYLIMLMLKCIFMSLENFTKAFCSINNLDLLLGEAQSCLW